MTTPPNFQLPKKLENYLPLVAQYYQKQDDSRLLDILVNGRISIEEDVDFDRWDGGQHGHLIAFTVAPGAYVQIVDDLPDVEQTIVSDLNRFVNLPHEYIAGVRIDVETVDDPEWRQRTGVHAIGVPNFSATDEAQLRIWGTGGFRVFLSHKVAYKVQTAKLKDALSQFGITAFVAHCDIEPSEEWQKDIESALATMDAIVVLLSEDFHDSNWTDQEVGVGIGRGVPVLTVRLGRDPYGFMGKWQSILECTWETPVDTAEKIFATLVRRLSNEPTLFNHAVERYRGSTSWSQSAQTVKKVLGAFPQASPNQVEQVRAAFAATVENSNSFSGRDAILPLMKRWTGEEWIAENQKLVRETSAS